MLLARKKKKNKNKNKKQKQNKQTSWKIKNKRRYSLVKHNDKHLKNHVTGQKKQKTKTKQTDNFNEIPTIHAVF